MEKTEEYKDEKVGRVGEVTWLCAVAIDDDLTKLDKKVLQLDRDMDIRIMEKESTPDKETTQKQLQKQGKQCEIIQTTFRQSLTTQNAQILQIQSDYQMSHCDTSQQVQQVRAEAKTQKTRMTTITMETQFRNETEKLRG